MRYLINVCAVFVLALLFGQATTVNAAQDTTAPILESVKLLTPDVKVGERVRYEVTVSDETEIQYVRILIASPSYKDNMLPIVYTPGEKKGTFIIESQPFEEAYESGKWFVEMVQTMDTLGNVKNYNKADLPNVASYSFAYNTNQTVTPTKPKEETPTYPTTPTTPKETITETKPTETTYTALPSRTNIKTDNKFMILFSYLVDETKLTNASIYVTDAQNNKVDVTVAASGKTITVRPKTAYKATTTYVLYISNVTSTKNAIAPAVKMQFTTK